MQADQLREQAAKSRFDADHPRAKHLIAGESDGRPQTPRKGKKAIDQPAAETPYATCKDRDGGEGKAWSDGHILVVKKRDVADKAGSQEYDASVYAANRAANVATQEQCKARHGSGAGTAFPVDVPPGGMDEERRHGEHVPLPRHKDLTGKVSSHELGDEAYRQQRELNASLHEAARHKKYGGSAAGQPEGGTARGAPYAMFGADGDEWKRENYTPRRHEAKVAGKIGGQEASFDAAVYKSNGASNAARQVENAQRKFGSAVMLSNAGPG